MGDAEIIPIGTRGRPGRGTGTQPSSAARGLAGTSRAAAKAAPKAAARPEPPSAPEPEPAPEAPVEVAEETVSPRPPVTTDVPMPDGIPAGEWLAAVQAAA